MYALAQGKRVVPVILDGTALSQELAPIHGIDVRQAFDHDPIQYEYSPHSDASRYFASVVQGMVTSFAQELNLPAAEHLPIDF
jgi:hypothetical protein